jgi:hypothetical protein
MGLDFEGDDIGKWCREKMANKVKSNEVKNKYPGATDAYIATRKCWIGEAKVVAGEVVKGFTSATAPCPTAVTATCGTGGKFVVNGSEIDNFYPACL